MPNTPALIQKGMSALAPGEKVTPELLELARAIFDAVGETVIVKEEMMDAVTAVSGSGPGYMFRIMECFVQAGVAVGFDEETSLGLVIQTVLGAAHLANESDKEVILRSKSFRNSLISRNLPLFFVATRSSRIINSSWLIAHGP